MDFSEVNATDIETNRRKNRVTLLALFAIFLLPVMLAYAAYFLGWFDGGKVNHGELIAADKLSHIEDYPINNQDDELIHGSVFETRYWWLLPIDPEACDESCQQLNLYLLRQTYIGLGKDSDRINLLIIFPQKRPALAAPFMTAYADFSHRGLLPKTGKTRSGKQITLAANHIYLVDPLGNIFMRYPIIKTKEEAYSRSKDLRFDIRHLFKFSGLG